MAQTHQTSLDALYNGVQGQFPDAVQRQDTLIRATVNAAIMAVQAYRYTNGMVLEKNPRIATCEDWELQTGRSPREIIPLFNDTFGKDITIHETGVKPRESAEAKLGRGIEHILDINRITVVPRTVELGKDLQYFLREQVVDEHENMSDRGHYDQNLWIASAASYEGDTAPGLQKGLLAEIKIVSPAMFEAARLTHPLYKLLAPMTGLKKRPKEPQELIDQPGFREGLPDKLQQAMVFCRENAIDTEMLAATRHGGTAEAPQWHARQFDETSLRGLYNVLNRMIQAINLAEVKKENDGWKREYLECAFATFHEHANDFSPSLRGAGAPPIKLLDAIGKTISPPFTSRDWLEEHREEAGRGR